MTIKSKEDLRHLFEQIPSLDESDIDSIMEEAHVKDRIGFNATLLIEKASRSEITTFFKDAGVNFPNIEDWFKEKGIK